MEIILLILQMIVGAIIIRFISNLYWSIFNCGFGRQNFKSSTLPLNSCKSRSDIIKDLHIKWQEEQLKSSMNRNRYTSNFNSK